MKTNLDGTELKEHPPRPSDQRTNAEFDPCCNAKITSPFYLYNHDSPRPSFEVKRPLSHVVVQDLEAATVNLSPTITQEKRDAENTTTRRFRCWGQKKQCLTKPKPRGCQWLAQLPPRQRLLVKILIAVVIIAAMVGIAVGITISVHGGVYKNGNSSTPIG